MWVEGHKAFDDIGSEIRTGEIREKQTIYECSQVRTTYWDKGVPPFLMHIGVHQCHHYTSHNIIVRT